MELVENSSPKPGHRVPRAPSHPKGPPKPWDSVQATKILFFPPSVCPSSGKCKFYYQRRQWARAQRQSRRRSNWKLSWSQKHNLCSAKPGPGILGDSSLLGNHGLEWGAQALLGGLWSQLRRLGGAALPRGVRVGQERPGWAPGIHPHGRPGRWLRLGGQGLGRPVRSGRRGRS